MTSTPMFNRYPAPNVIPTLEQVLTSGNSAENQNILNVNNINTMTINNLPYPPTNPQTKVQTFLITASVTWTIPAGTTYITAYILGGGGGIGNGSVNGSSSFVTYNGTSYQALGGNCMNLNFSTFANYSSAGGPNSGKGASTCVGSNDQPWGGGLATGVVAQDGQLLVTGFDVDTINNPTLTVIVGTGGSGGLAGGGSGVVTLHYY
jgi:hypothetical protein